MSPVLETAAENYWYLGVGPKTFTEARMPGSVSGKFYTVDTGVPNNTRSTHTLPFKRSRMSPRGHPPSALLCPPAAAMTGDRWPRSTHCPTGAGASPLSAPGEDSASQPVKDVLSGRGEYLLKLRRVTSGPFST